MSKKYKETFRQSVFALLISQIIVKCLGLVHKLYLTNRNGFGDAGNAISSAGFQVYSLIISFSSIGIPGAISRLVAERSSRGDHKGAYKIFKISVLIFSIIGLCGSLTLAIFSKQIACYYLKIPEAQLSIIALAPSVFFSTIVAVFRGYFGGRENQKDTAKAQSIDQITRTISTIIFIEISVVLMSNTNTTVMAACANLSSTVANICEFLYLYKAFLKQRHEIGIDIKSSANVTRVRTLTIISEIVKVAVPISLTAVIGTIAKNIDSTTIVNKLKDVIGYEQAKIEYGILSGKVETLVSFPLSFNSAITTALLPSIVASKSNLKKREDRINKSITFGLTLTVPIIVTFLFYGEEILKLLFPNASSGAVILKISSISILFITITQMLNVVLYGIGKSKVPIIAVTCGVLVKALLNNILVPKVNLPIGGTKGAAIATVAYNSVIFTISLIAVKKYTNITIYKSNLIKPLICSSLMIFSSQIAYKILSVNINNIVGLLISLILGLIIYIISLFLVKILNKNEIFFIKFRKNSNARTLVK